MRSNTLTSLALAFALSLCGCGTPRPGKPSSDTPDSDPHAKAPHAADTPAVDATNKDAPAGDAPDKGAPPPDAQFSRLWGQRGEKWNPTGRLADYSYAGYHAGEKQIPDVHVAASVADYGAVPDDDADDSAAIQKAIDATTSGAVLIPKGRYVVRNFINITRSGIVLRGEGQGADGTILYVPDHATAVKGKPHWGHISGRSGNFIIMRGGGSGNSVCRIQGEARRGTHTVRVSEASGIKAGSYLKLSAEDNEHGGELWRHLHANKLHSWPKHVNWAGANGQWLMKVASVDGNEVTLREPLRFDIRPPWRASLLEHNNISECGVENLRLEFKKIPRPPHLKEPGYNGVLFENAHNCWIRNVTIANADNGVTCYGGCAFVTMKDVTLAGRCGHHGISISYATNCLIDGLTEDSEAPWYHTVTMDHLACGNVNKGLTGRNLVTLDFHRHCPFENLHTDIRAQWNLASSGAGEAGPHAGARNTYWGMSGQAQEAARPDGQGRRDFLWRAWGKMQTNMVTDMAVPEKFTDDEEWYEDLPRLYPIDLHKAQLGRRRGTHQR